MNVLKTTLVGLLLAALAGTMFFVVSEVRRGTADYRGETEQIEQVRRNEQFRIQAYDSFFAQCAAVQTSEARINALTEELETNPSESRTGQINASLSAIKAQRASQINQYNADAANWQTGHFQDAALPARLNVNVKETTCAP